ncbi:glycosyltransferase family 4 protein [Maricaulis parjimensis]|uniref:glycosyltransferase family 4 protein n=1 Tax=Maricaulis parjimensis TaxID=144023 RepID=UPI00193A2425|nr:glycosyltransferase family 4 protein [Maricaulis parjimensis]
MKILQVIPELDAGGAERTTLEVAEAIIADGGEALVASQGGRLEGELEALGGRLIRMPLASKNPVTLWQNTSRLAKLIRQEGVDIVHARSRAPAWSAKWAADRTHAHFVTTYHGTYNAKSALKRRYNSVMARGELVIANSQFIASHIAQEHPFATPRIRVIPRGVELDRFKPGSVPQERMDGLAAAWGVGQDRNVLLLPGRLTGWKGQREAIRAMGRIRRHGEIAQPLLLLAGDAQGRDAYVAELEALIRSEGVQDNVRLVGHCTDMPAAFALSDLVLTPSNEPEAFGRTAAEAGAMEVPVIAADHGGAQEVILHSETGWRVQPGDDEALAAAIEGALSLSAEDRAVMGRRARAHVSEHFSTAALQASTLRVYREVLNSVP